MLVLLLVVLLMVLVLVLVALLKMRLLLLLVLLLLLLLLLWQLLVLLSLVPLVMVPVLLGRSCLHAATRAMQVYATFAPTLQGRWCAVRRHTLHVGQLVLLLRCRTQPRVGIIAWCSDVQETTFGTKPARPV